MLLYIYQHVQPSCKSEASVRLFHHTLADDGRVKVTGNKTLKSSQAYPPAFGRAVTLLHKQNEKAIKQEFAAFKTKVEAMEDSQLAKLHPQVRAWRDTDIASVIQALSE